MNPAEELKMELNAIGVCVDVLKDLPPASSARVVRRLNEAFTLETFNTPSNGKISAIQQLVESDDFRTKNTAQGRFVEELRFLEVSNPEGFAEAVSTEPDLKGKKRLYFALSKEAIDKAGKGTNPVKLNRWYADVNCSTAEKRKRMRKLMHSMGFSTQDSALAANAIR